MEREEYIDVRGPWPVYIKGLKAVELRNVILRDVPVEIARELAQAPVQLLGINILGE